MKLIVKETGDILTISPLTRIQVENYYDSYGNPMTFSVEEVTILEESGTFPTTCTVGPCAADTSNELKM